jgi:hypothetical protein
MPGNRMQYKGIKNMPGSLPVQSQQIDSAKPSQQFQYHTHPNKN